MKKKCKKQCELVLAMCKRSCIACDTGIVPPTAVVARTATLAANFRPSPSRAG